MAGPRRQQGEATWFEENRVVQASTFTCSHCQRVVIVPPKADPAELGGWCGRCGALICAGCVGGKCVPFEEKLARYERAAESSRRVDDYLQPSILPRGA